jgi:uncharacterized membrane protein
MTSFNTFRAAAIFAAVCSFAALCVEYPYSLETTVEVLTMFSVVSSVVMFVAACFSFRRWTAQQAGGSAVWLLLSPVLFLALLFVAGKEVNFHYTSFGSIFVLFFFSEIGAIILFIARASIASRNLRSLL